MRNEETVLNELLTWAQSQENIRAVVMTSSRADLNASIDLLSDYDIELIVTSLHDFEENPAWIYQFGNLLAHIKENGAASLTYLLLYSDGVRIDFQIYTLPGFLKQTTQSLLPKHWDIGYKILLDKDGITQKLPPPSFATFNISPPSREEFTVLVKDFWWDTTYIARSLWREEIFYAKYVFDSLIHYRYLVKMIEWYIGSQNEWTVSTNKYGRWFKRYLDNDTSNGILKTFADGDVENNWKALFATTQLFSRMATEVARQLNYEYSLSLEKNIIDYLKKIQKLDKNATGF